jgi:hypothetical protein
MDATLEVSVATRAYGDQVSTSLPARQFFNWNRRILRAAANPTGLPYSVPPGASQVIFDGTRSTSVGSASEFVLNPSAIPASAGRYRLAWDSTGQNPAFRTDRGLALSGHALTWTANANLTETLAATAGDFSGVFVGDVLFVPDTTTGDAAYPGNPLNAGAWTVIGKSGDASTVQLSRPSGAPWSGASEVVTPGSNSIVLAWSAAGVQVGDGFFVSAGFSAPVLGAYVALAVGPTYVEFETTKPLPSGAVAVPGSAGLVFYSNLKTWYLVNADQECHLLLNGGSEANDRIAPLVPGDEESVGTAMKDGPCWAMTVVNDSLQVLNVYVEAAE